MIRQVLTTAAPMLGSMGLASGPLPVLPGFLNSLSSPLGHYGLWAVLFFVLIEDFGIPVPGETILIAAAVFAGSGRLNVVAVGLVGFCAAVAGDNIGYAIGRFGGRALAERWGKYVFLTAERLEKAESFFHRHGGKIIVMARFIEGLRQANGLIAGIAEMKWLKFLAFNALGAALWVGTWVSAGYFAGQHITTIYNDVTRYSLYAAIVAAVVIAAWVGVRVRRHRRSRSAATAAAEDAGSSEAADAGTALEASDANTAVDAGDAGAGSGMFPHSGADVNAAGSADDGRDTEPPDANRGPAANSARDAEADLPSEAVRHPRGGPGALALRQVVAVGGDQDANRTEGVAGGGARGVRFAGTELVGVSLAAGPPPRRFFGQGVVSARRHARVTARNVTGGGSTEDAPPPATERRRRRSRRDGRQRWRCAPYRPVRCRWFLVRRRGQRGHVQHPEAGGGQCLVPRARVVGAVTGEGRECRLPQDREVLPVSADDGRLPRGDDLANQGSNVAARGGPARFWRVLVDVERRFCPHLLAGELRQRAEGVGAADSG